MATTPGGYSPAVAVRLRCGHLFKACDGRLVRLERAS